MRIGSTSHLPDHAVPNEDFSDVFAKPRTIRYIQGPGQPLLRDRETTFTEVDLGEPWARSRFKALADRADERQPGWMGVFYNNNKDLDWKISKAASRRGCC